MAAPSGHRIGKLALTGALGLTEGVHLDHVDAPGLASVDFADYTAIAIAFSFGGLSTRAELDELTTRSADIASYINVGGGLFASAECDSCGQDLLGASPNLFGYLPVDVSSIATAPPYNPMLACGAAPFFLPSATLNFRYSLQLSRSLRRQLRMAGVPDTADASS